MFSLKQCYVKQCKNFARYSSLQKRADIVDERASQSPVVESFAVSRAESKKKKEYK